MELVLLIVNVVAIFILGLFIKSYFPAYMGEKGKNLATKEDIADITRKTEEVTAGFQREMEIFLNDLHFNNDYAFKRYSILYTKVYSIVVQSEYFRFFYNNYEGHEYSIEEEPFIEITGEKKAEIDKLTSYNKKELCDFIIQNSEYASPKLLKLAIAYRYVRLKFGVKDSKGNSLSDSYDRSELKLIREIVKTIIIEYNEMRKIVNLSYSEHELETGELEHTDFK